MTRRTQKQSLRKTIALVAGASVLVVASQVSVRAAPLPQAPLGRNTTAFRSLSDQVSGDSVSFPMGSRDSASFPMVSSDTTTSAGPTLSSAQSHSFGTIGGRMGGDAVDVPTKSTPFVPVLSNGDGMVGAGSSMGGMAGTRTFSPSGDAVDVSAQTTPGAAGHLHRWHSASTVGGAADVLPVNNGQSSAGDISSGPMFPDVANSAPFVEPASSGDNSLQTGSPFLGSPNSGSGTQYVVTTPGFDTSGGFAGGAAAFPVDSDTTVSNASPSRSLNTLGAGMMAAGTLGGAADMLPGMRAGAVDSDTTVSNASPSRSLNTLGAGMMAAGTLGGAADMLPGMRAGAVDSGNTASTVQQTGGPDYATVGMMGRTGGAAFVNSAGGDSGSGVSANDVSGGNTDGSVMPPMHQTTLMQLSSP